MENAGFQVSKAENKASKESTPLAEMSREDLLNLAMGIRQQMEESLDEDAYLGLATEYGAVCEELEKRDKE